MNFEDPRFYLPLSSDDLFKIYEVYLKHLDPSQRFASYLETARLFFTVKKFDYSLGQQIRSISKVYTVDPGFYAAKGFKFSENYGHIAENPGA